MREESNDTNSSDRKNLPSTLPDPNTHIVYNLKAMIDCMGDLLITLVKEAGHEDNRSNSSFYCQTRPKISICEYLKSTSEL